MEAVPFTLLVPLTLLLAGVGAAAGIAPIAEVVVAIVLVVPGVFALHGPATVFTTVGVPPVPVIPGRGSGLPTVWPGMVVLL